MKIKILSLLLLTGLFAGTLFAQNKELTLKDVFSRNLYPKTLRNLQWKGNSGVSWVDNNSLIFVDVKSLKNDTILKLDKINDLLAKSGAEKLRSFPSINWIDENTFTVEAGNAIYKVNVAEGNSQLLNSWKADQENRDMAAETFYAAYTRDNNLYVSVNGSEKAITNDSEKNIVNGQSVHRNEFGIYKGTFWSPKGNLLAFYRMDQTMVTDYPIINIDERTAVDEPIKYPMAGMKSHEVTVGVYNPATGGVVFLKTGEPKEQYLTNISWSGDEKTIYIAVLNRAQDHMWLNAYDAKSGDFIKTLFEETDKEYVEPLNGLTFLKTKPDQFIWQSRRDGWNHLYLYETSGKLISQLTKGNWEVDEFLGMDTDETHIYYTSTLDGPLERQVFVTDMKSGQFRQLTTNKGTHSVVFSPDKKFFADRNTSLSYAVKYSLVKAAKAEYVKEIYADANPLKDYAIGKTEFLTLKSSDGSDLYARITKPANFDPSKKYPAIVYVYGGPHSQLVADTWLGGSNLYFQILANKGYIVFTLDNHGTQARGADFEQAVHRHLGDWEVEDQMVGVNYLISLPFVDSERLGIDGWSYGGFMTLSMILRNPGVFKVATCGGPVVDWQWYEVMYGERYMDTPDENPEGYKKACLLNYVDKLDTRLMVMHGALDNTVVWQHSLRFIQECIKKGKQVDYFVFPNHEHNVSGTDRLYMYEKLILYYQEHL